MSTTDQRRRLQELRDRKGLARQRMSAAREAVKLAGSDQEARRAAEAAVELARGEAEVATQLEATILGQLSGNGGDGFGDFALNDPAVVQELESLAVSSRPLGERDLGPVMSSEEFVASLNQNRRLAAGIDWDGQGDGVGRVAPFGGVVPALRRPLSVLDLFPSATLDNKTLTYVAEIPNYSPAPSGAPGSYPPPVSGSDTAIATAVEKGEGSIAAEATLTLDDREAVARTVSHWSKVPREVLADVAGLQTLVTDRLLYGTRVRLERQVLSGDGQGENILGLLAPEIGVPQVVYDASETPADQILAAITSTLVAGAVPTGVVINPLDWQAMLKVRSGAVDNSWHGSYLSMGPFLAAARSLWGVATIPSPAVAPGTALIGDFGLGATLLIRQAPMIRLSDADQDDFVRGRTTLYADLRATVAVWSPYSFCSVDLTGT